MRQITSVVAGAYSRIAGPVAYLDETFNVDPRHPGRFYVMTAVLVAPTARDALRADMQQLVGAPRWHTTQELRTPQGRARVRELLNYLAHPQGSELCVVSHESMVAAQDREGEQARAACLGVLLEKLTVGFNGWDPVRLFVLERRREARQSNRDAATRQRLVAAARVPANTHLLQVTPSDEPLLWLADVVCSAYRQHVARRDHSYLSLLRDRVVVLKN